MLVPEVVLAAQQAAAFVRHGGVAPDRVGAFSSERPLTAAGWPRHLAAHDVLIATGQSLLNVLAARPRALEDVGLLILDECHHTRGESPYAAVMARWRRLRAERPEAAPQVLGLTASPGGEQTAEGTGRLVAALTAALGARLISLDDGRAAAAAAPAEAVEAAAAAASASRAPGAVINTPPPPLARAGSSNDNGGGDGGGAGGGGENGPASGGGPTERALTLRMREVDGEVWRSLLAALLRGFGRVGAAIRGVCGGVAFLKSGQDLTSLCVVKTHATNKAHGSLTLGKQNQPQRRTPRRPRAARPRARSRRWRQ